MNAFSKAAVAGAAGAVATNVAHELVRRVTPDAPRVDLLGMQALAKLVRGAGVEPPHGGALYRATFAGDLLSNAAYFALVGVVPRGGRLGFGLGIGALAGVGAVVLPPRLGLAGAATTSRTTATAALTIAYYTLGGIVAGTLAARR